MKYAVMFDSKADAKTLENFLSVAKIRHAGIEVLDEGVMAMAFEMQRSCMELVIAVEAEASTRKLNKLRDEFARCCKAFEQAPTPALSTVLKTLAGQVKRAEKAARGD